ncbi:MAG: caspase family protein [Bacteroidales bacterium]
MKKLGFLLVFSIISIFTYSQQSGCISGDCDNGFGTWLYPNGDKYTGNWVNKQMHGNGTYFYKNGDVYKGDFRNNKLEGFGTCTFKNGDRYTGEYANNLTEGEGTYFYANGKVEKGLWVQGKFFGESKKTGCLSGDCVNGKGIYVFDNGEKYIGEIKNSKREGKGTYFFNSGEWYKGEWKNNQRNGEGTNYFADGEKYTGNWKNDQRNGYGTHTYVDGTVKTGMWEMGRYVGTGNNNYGCISGNCENGYGVFRWQDGEKYVGNFKNKLRHGYGSNYWADGRIYEGTWVNDKMNGYGKESMGPPLIKNTNQKNMPLQDEPVQIIKDGFWENGIYSGTTYSKAGCLNGDCNNGYGTLILKTGDRYVGQFKDGIYSGFGSLDYIKGGKYTGEFKNGKFEGSGTLRVPDKGKYIGYFVNGMFDGLGTFYYDDGRVVAGKWKENKFSGTAQNDLQVPAVKWLNPATNELTVQSIEYNLRLCINSKEKPQNIQVYVNDELKINNAINGLTVNSDCNYVFDRTLTLKSGDNTVKVIVKNGAGETTSEVRKLIYDNANNKMIKRYALIIGNSTYKMGPLRNPTNDASAMAEQLKKLGFEVSLYINQGKEDLKTHIREFGDKLTANKGVGLFFYAGHGLQVAGENYIIPVDAHIAKLSDIESEAVNLSRLTGEMAYAKNDMNIIILDACRNNPFEGEDTGPKGLASTSAPSGTLIAFATAPGSVAADGSGQNGLYTQELLKAIAAPGAKIEDVFKEVRRNVYKLSEQQQTPWENSSIFEDFYFKK